MDLSEYFRVNEWNKLHVVEKILLCNREGERRKKEKKKEEKEEEKKEEKKGEKEKNEYYSDLRTSDLMRNLDKKVKKLSREEVIRRFKQGKSPTEINHEWSSLPHSLTHSATHFHTLSL